VAIGVPFRFDGTVWPLRVLGKLLKRLVEKVVNGKSGLNDGEFLYGEEVAIAANEGCAEGHGGCSHPQVILVEGQAPARAMAQMTTLSSAPMDESHDPICGSARMRALTALVSRR